MAIDPAHKSCICDIIKIKFKRCGEISQIKLFKPYRKTSHTTWTLIIKIQIICLYNSQNKFEVQVVWLVFLYVQAKDFDMRDFFTSFCKCYFCKELAKEKEITEWAIKYMNSFKVFFSLLTVDLEHWTTLFIIHKPILNSQHCLYG